MCNYSPGYSGAYILHVRWHRRWFARNLWEREVESFKNIWVISRQASSRPCDGWRQGQKPLRFWSWWDIGTERLYTSALLYRGWQRRESKARGPSWIIDMRLERLRPRPCERWTNGTGCGWLMCRRPRCPAGCSHRLMIGCWIKQVLCRWGGSSLPVKREGLSWCADDCWWKLMANRMCF